METDGWGVAGANYLPKPVDAGANRGVVPHLGPRLRPNTHWLAFAAEVFLIAVVPALAAAPVARRPYSERLRAWYRQDTVLLTRRSSAALAVALQADAVDEWAESEYETTTRKEDQYPLTIWYCPRPADGADFEPTVYLAPYAAKLARLAPEEVAALAGVFPLLVEWADRKSVV